MTLQPVTPRNLFISWQPPPVAEQNGEIIHYTAVVVEEESGLNVTEVQTENIELLVEGLKPFYVYSVALAASTTIGRGPYTLPSLIEMPEDGTYIIIIIAIQGSDHCE